GRLPVTFNGFVMYGIHRHAISAAIRECTALGFIEVTEQGRAGNAEFRSPNRFRLTYAYAIGLKPTHEWAKIETNEQAQALFKAGRRPPKADRKTENQCRKTPVFDGGNRHRNAKIPVVVSGTTCAGTESVTTSIFRGGVTPSPEVKQ